MWGELLKPAVEYLKGQPFNNVLIAAMLGVIVYVNIRREEQTKDSHEMVHQVFKEIRAESQMNQDRLVEAMTGMKREQQRTTAAVAENTAATQEIPIAAVKAADVLVKKAAEDKGE
jgi:hypothetical protein